MSLLDLDDKPESNLSTRPGSPLIHGNHIHPSETPGSPGPVDMNNASGSVSVPHSNDLQTILDQFDPLTQKKDHEQQKQHETEHAPESSKTSSKEDLSSSMNEKTKIGSGSNEPANTDELPFDFQRFLDQLRHKSADPIARYLKSFLNEFNKRNWTTEEQVKIIGDFKAFISRKMDECPPFSTLSDTQMDNALEGMEKLIMNRLYLKTFSPEIPRNKRTDYHEEDIIRDRVLDDKISIWYWVEGRHLDIPNKFLRNGEAFVNLASEQLKKINHFRAPRDKMICLLNCCKVIFGLLRQSNSEENADGFLPILIYVVIKAHPQHMISNLNYIQRFRNPDKLNGEAGYYLSSLQGAISFIEALDRSSLSISDEEFSKNVDSSVKIMSAKAQKIIDENNSNRNPPLTPDLTGVSVPASPKGANQSISSKPEKALTPGKSGNSSPSGSLTPSAVLQNSAGLLTAPFRSLSKILSTESVSPVLSPSPPNETKVNDTKQLPKTSPEELAARQISAEEEEARRISNLEFESVVETLSQMFSILDRDIIKDIVIEKQGRVGAAVDACLSLTQT